MNPTPASPAGSGKAFQTYGTPATVYSTGAKIAPGATVFFSAGDLSEDPKTDTKTQAIGAMESLKGTLAEAGFTLSDVVFARAYLAPDASGKADFAGWNAAWNTVFNNPSHPHKPARTTVAVPKLGNSGHLIEIEFVCAATAPAKMSAGSAALKLPSTNARLTPFGTKERRIYDGMGILPGTGLYWTAGTLKKKDCRAAAPGESETYVQSYSTLENLAENLGRVGLTFKDIVFLRAFLAPDATRDNTFDHQGWNKAFDEFFNNAKNPHKPARTTVSTPTYGTTPALVNEIEVIAAFPGATDIFSQPNPKNSNLRTYTTPEAQIASAVGVKGGAGFFFSAGQVGEGKTMKEQSLSALGKLKDILAAAGVGFQDVVFLRAYITQEADGSLDRAGWSEAYHTCFNFPGQPHKPARTTIAVHSLPRPEAKIEIDVIAALP